MSYPQPGSKVLRRGRVSIAGQVYLVTTSTDRRQPQLADFWMGRTVVRAMQQIQAQGLATTLAYVVMPDHMHWLFELGNARLVDVVRLVKGRSAYAIAASSSRPGRVWQSGFHDHALRTEERVIDAARYVIANPLRAGLVTRLGDYPLWDCVWV